MNCLTCNTKMDHIDDVCQMVARVDLLKCPKCSSTATLVYGAQSGNLNEVTWKR